MEIYKQAAQFKLRFQTNRGQVTTEQLFDMPLKATDNFDLNTVAQTIHKQLKSLTTESFVEEVKADSYQTELSIALEVVKDVIKTKQDANKAEVDRIKRAAERRKILDAIAAKKEASLSAASLEELEAKLNALD